MRTDRKGVNDKSVYWKQVLMESNNTIHMEQENMMKMDNHKLNHSIQSTGSMEMAGHDNLVLAKHGINDEFVCSPFSLLRTGYSNSISFPGAAINSIFSSF
jgi:hypothetical protein